MDGIFQKYNFLVNQGKIMLPRACQKLLAVVQQEVTDGQATWIISKNTWRWLVCPAGSLPGQYKHMITSILKKKKTPQTWEPMGNISFKQQQTLSSQHQQHNGIWKDFLQINIQSQRRTFWQWWRVSLMISSYDNCLAG